MSLAVYTALNFLNYLDRYVLPPVLESIKGDPAFAGVSDYQLGLLQSAFFFVYMVLSPLAGIAGRRVPRRYLVALGVGTWSAATLLSGMARGYGELFAARALIGAGEGGYATLAPAILSDLFAPDRRSRVLALFYVATPVGSALGMMLGGLIAAHHGWRAAFFVAGAPGFLLAVAVLLLPEPARGAMDADARPDLAGASPRSVGAEYRALLHNRAWLRVTFGNALIAFAIGGLAYWMPSYFQVARGFDARQAGLVVGACAVVGGLVGTVAGGFLGDAWRRRDPQALFRLSGLGMLLGAPLLVAVPLSSTTGLAIGLLALANTLFFLNTGPLNTALVESAPASFREGAVGLHILVIHLLGDAISPSILGALTGVLSPSLGRGPALGTVMALTVVPVLGCAAVLLIGLPRCAILPAP